MTGRSNLDVILADRSRPSSHRARDLRDHTKSVLVFSSIKAGDKVVDFLPFRGYFTRLFAALVGPEGRVYAVAPREFLKIDRIATALKEVEALANSHHQVEILTGPVQSLGGVPKGIDSFWIAQNYHDLHDKFMGPVNIARFNANVFRNLRKGGGYIVSDHSAGAHAAMDVMERLHRIDPAVVRAEVLAAGFVYDGANKAMRNPADTHRTSVFARTIRYHTDRFVLKFHKPT